MAETLNLPKWDIKISTAERGLLVSQHDRTYLARKWRLSPQVRDVIGTALKFGLHCLWQEGHPSKNESHHISFSFSHDPHSWVFVIGGEAGPPSLKFVTFHKRLKGYFKEAGFGWTWDWENAGGKNILVHPDHLCTILERLPLEDIKAGLLPTYDPGRILNRTKNFVRSEAELEDVLYATFRNHSQVRKLDRQRSFIWSAPDERAVRPDLILELADKFVVAELKVGSCPEADVAQVRRYLRNSALLRAYSGKPLYGVLIGSHFKLEAIAEAKRSGVSLYTYDEMDGVQLRLIQGDDVLPVRGPTRGSDRMERDVHNAK